MIPVNFSQALGSIGFFSSRIFLPALLTALLIRFGADIPFLRHTPLVTNVHHHPAWFTSDASIAILSVLSILEVVAQKSPDTRRLLHEFDAALKAAMALLTSFGMISATDSKFVAQTTHQAGVGSYLSVVISTIGVLGVSRVRGATLAALHEIDHEDGLHLQRLISWGEDAWVIFGMLLLVLYPVFMLILIAAAIGLLFLFRAYLESIEQHTKTPCTRCQTLIYPSAIACPHCRTAVSAPHAVGFLGQSKSFPDPDPANHRFRLIEKRRCPVCAEHLKVRLPHQRCPACDHDLFADPGSVDAYLAYVSARFPVVLGISTALSLVPLLGLLAGTVYFRFQLVNPFSVYLPFGKRFMLRWGIRLLFVLLFFFQLVPVIGAVIVPLMAAISFYVYRTTFQTLAREPASERSPATAWELPGAAS